MVHNLDLFLSVSSLVSDAYVQMLSTMFVYFVTSLSLFDILLFHRSGFNCFIARFPWAVLFDISTVLFPILDNKTPRYLKVLQYLIVSFFFFFRGTYLCFVQFCV